MNAYDGRVNATGEDRGVRVGSSGATAEELAQMQGVEVVDDIEALAGDWPEEDSLDEFLLSLRRSRA
ncbi:MAG: hypothetical protein C4547_01065 [Phycisphaerales bacterium]|nr:MAG: hypothetical protein C4547_01065 [Phycisphaerales bacterium]